jgi:diguanylate cyclase (GGDEF)-like protein
MEVKMKRARIKKAFLVFIPIYIIIYYFWLIYWKDCKQIMVLGGDIFSMSGSLIASISLFFILKRLGGSYKKFWMLIFWATCSYTMGEVVWNYYELILGITVPYPGLPDLFYIMSSVLELIAINYIIFKDRSFSNLRIIFDILITITVAITLCWVFIINPTLNQKEIPICTLFVSVFYPVISIGELLGMLSILFSNKSIINSNVLRCLIASLSIRIFADFAYTYSTLNNFYYSGILYDPLWILSILLYILAALIYREFQENYSENNFNYSKRIYLLVPMIKTLIPYISVNILFIIMVYRLNNIDAIIIGCIMCIFLVIIRQLTIILENQSLIKRLSFLNEDLERKVKQRTEELFEKNTQLITALNDMEYMAYHDSLTGLTNRRLFEEKLSKEIVTASSNNKKIAVLFLDLDNFKNINDTLGHTFGDLLLKNVAKRIKECISKNDLISREGGDEFTILLTRIDKYEDILYMAKKLQNNILKNFTINGIEVRITASIGVSIYPDHDVIAENLIKYADIAMYRAKENGKNGIEVYLPKMKDIISKKMLLENALRKAIDRNEFLVYFQPQININTKNLIGFEALIRWNSNDLGMVSPAEFIPLAEESGLIIPIGEWILKRACEQLVLWHNQGFQPFKISVNISHIQFKSEDLVKVIRRIIKETNIDPKFIELEITESVAMFNEELIISKLNQLKNLGVQIAIDDFGTGYSSLSYLKKFPVNTLKIDQTFVRDMFMNNESLSLVAGIISMAHNMRFKVIAEGVETNEQLMYLGSVGCDVAQGYLFSKPLPANQLQSWMEKYKSK